MEIMAVISKKILVLALMYMMLITSSLAQDSSYVKGIDVSHNNGDIDWSQVSQQGIQFAFIKATEGIGWQDPQFKDNKDNIDSAQKAGLKVGAYHYARPDSGNDASAEAKWFVQVARDYIKPGYLPPALDIEWDHSNVESKSPSYLANWINTWMSTVKDLTGVEPIIYTHHYYVEQCMKGQASLADYDIWMADTSDPAPDLAGIWSKWTFWQYKIGSVSGITGDVDLDYFNGDYSGLSNYV